MNTWKGNAGVCFTAAWITASVAAAIVMADDGDDDGGIQPIVVDKGGCTVKPDSVGGVMIREQSFLA